MSKRVIDLNCYTGGGLQIESNITCAKSWNSNCLIFLMWHENDVMDFVSSLECQRNLDI